MRNKWIVSNIPQKQHTIPAHVLPNYSEDLLKLVFQKPSLNTLRTEVETRLIEISKMFYPPKGSTKQSLEVVLLISLSQYYCHTMNEK